MPLRHGNRKLVEQYVDLLTVGERFQLTVFDRIAAEHYARIRASTSVPQPDAIQLACAAAAEATTFITNDQQIWDLKVAGIDTICGL